jgi:hypothetical protein
MAEHVLWKRRGPLAWTNNVAAIVRTIVACEQDTNASERTVTYVIAMMGILKAQRPGPDQEPPEHAREFEVYSAHGSGSFVNF